MPLDSLDILNLIFCVKILVKYFCKLLKPFSQNLEFCETAKTVTLIFLWGFDGFVSIFQ